MIGQALTSVVDRGLKSRLGRLWTQSWSMALGAIGTDEIGWLFHSTRHTMRLTALRAGTIVSRVQLSSGVLAVLLLAWALIDAWAQPTDMGLSLAPARMLTAVAFAGTFFVVQRMNTMRDAYRALIVLMAVPAVYVVFCLLRAPHVGAPGLASALESGYAIVPLVMLAGLSLFPLTVLESGLFAVATLGLQVLALDSAGGWLAAIWALPLAAIAIAAGVSQLVFQAAMVREGLYDALTGAYSRRAGEALLELQFTWASRRNTGLALALVGLDRLQEVNEKFGYNVGDTALRSATQILNDSLRAGDILIRWTGNEYALVFPNATAGQAAGAVSRLLSHGLGMRPDRTPYTASIGVADRVQDSADDWWRLVDLAHSRMQTARQAGGNRTVER